MRDHRKIIKFTELFLILFVWMVLLATPVLFREENNNPIWDSMLKQLEILVPLSLLIVLNRFFLVPGILLKGKPFYYLVAAVGLIVLLTFASYSYDRSSRRVQQPIEMNNPPQRRTPPKEPPREGPPPKQELPGPQGPSEPVPAFANFLILAVLMMASDTGLLTTLKWTKAEQDKTELEKENVANQLLLLRNQVSPHFLMNTLNNIHSMVDVNSGEAKNAIIKLSKMMRYLLYETESQNTTLAREIEFIENYISLMKIRFNEKVAINLHYTTPIPNRTLPPLLFIPFIENAFKHGISYKQQSFVNLDLTIGKERLLFVAKNQPFPQNPDKELKGSGIGNVRKRLELLYGNRFNLDIIESKDLFTVNLSIPI